MQWKYRICEMFVNKIYLKLGLTYWALIALLSLMCSGTYGLTLYGAFGLLGPYYKNKALSAGLEAALKGRPLRAL